VAELDADGDMVKAGLGAGVAAELDGVVPGTAAGEEVPAGGHGAAAGPPGEVADAVAELDADGDRVKAGLGAGVAAELDGVVPGTAAEEEVPAVGHGAAAGLPGEAGDGGVNVAKPSLW
jgi:hypothetical protein